MKRETILFKKIFSLNKKVLKDLNILNSARLVIGIAGVPGSGKTLLARQIASRYHAVRISNDEIRRIINRFDIVRFGYRPDEGQKVLIEYLPFLISSLSKESLNKFLVLDSGIERKYTLVKRWCKDNRFRLFVIQISLSRKQLMKNLYGRKKPAERYLPDLPRYFREYAAFARRKVGDVVFRNDGKIKTLRSFVGRLRIG